VTYEFQFTLFETKGTQVRSLSVDGSKFEDASLRTSSLSQLPGVDLPPIELQSLADIETAVMNGLLRRTQRDATVSVFLTIDVVQNSFGAPKQNGERSHSVRAGRLTLTDLAAAPSPTLTAKQLQDHTLNSFLKFIEAVCTTQAQRRRVLPLPSDNTASTVLLAPAFGSTSITSCIGTVDLSSIGPSANTIETLLKLRTITNNVKSNGGSMDTVVASMNDEISRLKKMLDAAQGNSGEGTSTTSQTTKSQLAHEIAEKEAALEELQATTNRAVARYEEVQNELEQTKQKVAITEEKLEKESEEKTKAQFDLSSEKQKAFAAAFKNAFLVGKQQLQNRAQGDQAKEEIEEADAKTKHLEMLLKASKEENERSQFEVQKLQKEVRKLEGDDSELHALVTKLKRELHESKDQVEELKTKVNLAKFEATHETHDLRRELAAVEQKFDNRGFEIDNLKADIHRLESELEQASSTAAEHLREQLASTREELRNAHADVRTKSHALHESELNRSDLAHRLESMQAELQRRDQSIDQLTKLLDSARLREQERIGKLKELHSIEREGYFNLLAEGSALLEELRKVERCLIDRPSSYRSGWPGVVAWLNAIGLSQYQSAFQLNGFVDMHTVSQIQESDLIEMKLLRGSRRKVLAEAELVKKQLSGTGTTSLSGTLNGTATSLSQTTSPRRAGTLADQTSDAKKVLDEFAEWVKDFSLCIRSEGEESGKAA
jgi:hypothetical protein